VPQIAGTDQSSSSSSSNSSSSSSSESSRNDIVAVIDIIGQMLAFSKRQNGPEVDTLMNTFASVDAPSAAYLSSVVLKHELI
jgi:hypothetical protein